MNRRSFGSACLFLCLFWCTMPAFADSADKRPLDANKNLILEFFRVVFEAENAEAAGDYLQKDFVQHNPKVLPGKDGFIKYYKAKWKRPKPVKPELMVRPVEIIAEGDFVSVMWKYQKEDPADKKKRYDAFWFDLFRLKNSKIAEHWDNAVR